MYVFADTDTARLLRLLATDGPMTADDLGTRLGLSGRHTRRILSTGRQHGVITSGLTPDLIELDRAALCASVSRARDELLGVAA